MRNRIFLAGLAAAALIPTIASAQQSCEERHDSKVAGTLAGAGVGALLGAGIAGHGDRGAGAVIGAVGGGIVGNSLAGSAQDCARSYGYYDRDGAWHANGSRGYYDDDGHYLAAAPRGYYDRDGRWIDGAPAAGSYTTDVAYEGRDRWANAPLDIGGREAWLDQRIRKGISEGTITRSEAAGAFDELRSIRRKEAELRRDDGRLRGNKRDYIEARLDSLNDRIHWMRHNDDRNY
jgi:hypothetical protein